MMTQRLHQWLAVVWLAILISLALIIVKQGLAFDTSIMALLPKTHQNANVALASDKTATEFANNAVLLVSHPDRETARAGVEYSAQALARLGDLARVTWRADGGAVLDELYPYRFSVLSASVRDRLRKGDFDLQKQLALHRLFSPFSGVKADPLLDPFTLYSDFILDRQAGFKVKPDQGLISAIDSEGFTYMISLKLAGDAFSLPVQRQLMQVITPLQADLNERGIKLEKAGLVWHAQAGAQQAEAEISTIGAGSIIGVLLILLIVFRSLSSLFLVLVPILVGCVAALAITVLTFERVHLITLAFGAGLVGVSVDYTLHYLCESRVYPAQQALDKLLMGLVLGLASSVVAYSCLALAPFPGLQQMAIFSVAGLIGAWLTVVLWLPFLLSKTPQGSLHSADLLYRIRQSLPRLDSRPLMMLGVLVLGIGSGFIVYQSEPRDSIRLLQTSSQQMYEEDRSVQQRLGTTNNGQFILISGTNIESVLQAEERLLEQLHQISAVQGYQSLSQVLPSQARQLENGQLVAQLYAEQLEHFAGIAGMSARQIERAVTAMQAGVVNRLSLDHWLTTRESEIWRSMIVINEPRLVQTLIRFIGGLGPEAKSQIKALVGNTRDAVFVDRAADISQVLTDYRKQITFWLGIALFLVSLLLWIRYRGALWRIILPPLIASLVTFAGLVILTGGYNLFNLVALMLVFGIGLDMGIFMYESVDSDHSWLAVSLSAITSILAFGLLSLSKTPVLYHFGIVVLPGLTLVWLMSPLVRKVKIGEKSGPN